MIKAPTTEMARSVLIDIRMCKLSCTLEFVEVKAAALERMCSHATTNEDPVGLLAAIYDGGEREPDADMKIWVRRFLIRTPASPGVFGTEVLHRLYPAPAAEPSNLAKLEADMLGFRARFYALLKRSCALRYKVGCAKRELLAVRPVAVRCLGGRADFSPAALRFPPQPWPRLQSTNSSLRKHLQNSPPRGSIKIQGLQCLSIPL